MNNLLTQIGEALLIVNFISLLLILNLRQEKTAFEVVVFGLTILGVVHLSSEYALLQKQVFVMDVWLTRALWYLGFAFTYLAYMTTCCLYCMKKNLKRDKASNIILLSILIASIIQIARYIDRFIVETDLLEYLYTNGIPTINTICTLSIGFYVTSKYAVVYVPKITSHPTVVNVLRGLEKWIA